MLLYNACCENGVKLQLLVGAKIAPIVKYNKIDICQMIACMYWEVVAWEVSCTGYI